MIQSSEQALRVDAVADLESLVLLIAASPIVVRSQARPLTRPWTLEARLADWANTRQQADVDDVVLAWIASHVDPRRRRAALS